MSSSTPVSSNERVEGAGLTARPKRAGLPSVKVRSADNAAVPALSSHRAAQASGTTHESTTLANTFTPAATSVPNTPSISRCSPTVASADTGLGTTTDDVTDDDGVALLAGMTRKCE